MVQRPDDARTETVQLLHGLRPQAERQVRVQAVVPEKPTTKPTQTEGSECRRHAEESSEKTEHLIDHRTRCRSVCKGSAPLSMELPNSLKDFTCISQGSSTQVSTRCYNSPVIPLQTASPDRPVGILVVG